MYQPHVAIEHHWMVIEFFRSPMGCVDSWWSKKFGHHSSSLKVTEKFQLPTVGCTFSNQKILVSNWLAIQLVIKGNWNWSTNGDWIYFNHQRYNGPMVTEPLFGQHPTTLSLWCLQAIRWQPKSSSVTSKFRLLDWTQCHIMHSMVTKGDWNRARPGPKVLAMYGSTIRSTFLSFLVQSSPCVWTLFALNN
jgi:hypothetical protein